MCFFIKNILNSKKVIAVLEKLMVFQKISSRKVQKNIRFFINFQVKLLGLWLKYVFGLGLKQGITNLKVITMK